MIGKTNSRGVGQPPCEKINITCLTSFDQSALTGAVITISYEDVSNTYIWDGTTVSVSIPADVEYTVAFSSVIYYLTPDIVTLTALPSNVREIKAVYEPTFESLVVNVTGIPSGFEVQVINSDTGSIIGTQATETKVYNITNGTSYYVKGLDVSNYVTPSDSDIYTATAGNARTVTMTYTFHAGTTSPTEGIWIQDTDGYYHATSEWDGNYTPNGIAVITSNCRFVIALDDTHYVIEDTPATAPWSTDEITVAGITSTSDRTVAQQDYNGYSQSIAINNALAGGIDDKANAAYFCLSYIFPNGQKGYMGAAGEWQAALDNKDAIDLALYTCNAVAMDIDLYWTSTQVNDMLAWAVSWIDGILFSYNTWRKMDTLYTRAFTSIQ